MNLLYNRLEGDEYKYRKRNALHDYKPDRSVLGRIELSEWGMSVYEGDKMFWGLSGYTGFQFRHAWYVANHFFDHCVIVTSLDGEIIDIDDF